VIEALPGERQWLTDVLTREIPLGRAMQLQVERLDDRGIELSAPLAPNVNDKGTAFGGAMVSLMILAGWSLPRLLLRRERLEADLVIGRCQVRFAAPVGRDFLVACDWPDVDAIEIFTARLRESGRGRLELEPRVVDRGEVAAGLQARYAALMSPVTRCTT
jgi:thioesterase domain-containing protein